MWLLSGGHGNRHGSETERVKSKEAVHERKRKLLPIGVGKIWTGLDLYCTHMLSACVFKHVTVVGLLDWLLHHEELNQASSQRANVKCEVNRTQLCHLPSLSTTHHHMAQFIFIFSTRVHSIFWKCLTRYCSSSKLIYISAMNQCNSSVPVGSLNTALASACVWMILFRSTAMLGTLFWASCFSAACKDEGKKTHTLASFIKHITPW